MSDQHDGSNDDFIEQSLNEWLQLGHGQWHLCSLTNILDGIVEALRPYIVGLATEKHGQMRFKQRYGILVTEGLREFLQLLFSELGVAILRKHTIGRLACNPLNLPADEFVTFLDFLHVLCEGFEVSWDLTVQESLEKLDPWVEIRSLILCKEGGDIELI